MFSITGRLFWTLCSLLFNRVALADLNWGLTQQAGEKGSARVPFLACQLSSHPKGATECQMEMIHLFLDCCLIYSVTVQNKPAPFLFPSPCAWKVGWKWSTVLDFVFQLWVDEAFSTPLQTTAELAEFPASHMGNPTGLKCLLTWAIKPSLQTQAFPV